MQKQTQLFGAGCFKAVVCCNLYLAFTRFHFWQCVLMQVYFSTYPNHYIAILFGL